MLAMVKRSLDNIRALLPHARSFTSKELPSDEKLRALGIYIPNKPGQHHSQDMQDRSQEEDRGVFFRCHNDGKKRTLERVPSATPETPIPIQIHTGLDGDNHPAIGGHFKAVETIFGVKTSSDLTRVLGGEIFAYSRYLNRQETYDHGLRCYDKGERYFSPEAHALAVLHVLPAFFNGVELKDAKDFKMLRFFGYSIGSRQIEMIVAAFIHESRNIFQHYGWSAERINDEITTMCTYMSALTLGHARNWAGIEPTDICIPWLSLFAPDDTIKWPPYTHTAIDMQEEKTHYRHTRVSRHKNVKQYWILLKPEMVLNALDETRKGKNKTGHGLREYADALQMLPSPILECGRACLQQRALPHTIT
jgi:hypothetical protein